MTAAASSQRPGLRDARTEFSECNSCWGGGKLGVSDVFAASLWAADFCLSVASLGAVGVNFHGGGNGRYSPIVGDQQTGYQARPEFYGLLLAQHFAGHSLLRTSITGDGSNLTSYAAGAQGKPKLILVVNKGSKDADLEVTGLQGARHASMIELRAPSLTSKTNIALQGGEVKSDGNFEPQWRQPLNVSSFGITLRLEGYSAALVRLT